MSVLQRLARVRGDQLARQWLLIQRLAHSRGGVALDALAESLGCVRRTVYRDLDALAVRRLPGGLREARRPRLLPLSRDLPPRRRALHARRDPRAGLRRGPAARARGHGLPRLDPLGARQDPRLPLARAQRVPGAARGVVPRAARPAQELRAAARDDPGAERRRRRAPRRAHALRDGEHRRDLDARARSLPRLVPQRRALRGRARPQVGRDPHLRRRSHPAARADGAALHGAGELRLRRLHRRRPSA